MRVHRTSSGRRACGAVRLGFLLVAVAIAHVARANDGGDAPTVRVAAITLTADRVRDWEEEGVHYVLLEGFAAVFRGDDGVRAEKAVVRITTRPNPEGGTTHELEIYAEGNARRSADDGGGGRSVRDTWTTTGPVSMTASNKDLRTLPRAPAAEILSRAFGPRAVAAEKKAEKPARPKEEEVAPAAEESHGLPPLPEEAIRDPAVKLAAAEDVAEPKPDDTRPARVREPGYRQVQFIDGPGFPQLPGEPPPAPPANDPARRGAPAPDDFGPAIDAAPPSRPGAGGARPAVPDTPRGAPATELEPLPGIPANRPRTPAPPEAPLAPIMPGTRRITTIYGGPNFAPRQYQASDGTKITVITGGVNIVTNDPKQGTIDVESDNAIIWNKPKPGSPPQRVGPEGELIQAPDDPMEVYLEGHVILRRDPRKLQGSDDQTVYRATRAYYDYMADRFIGLDAEVNVFAPGLIAPMKINTPRMDQYHPLVAGPDGQMIPQSFESIRVQQSVSTGSRFANPGYKFTSRSLDLTKVLSDNVPPDQGGDAPPDVGPRTTWRIDSRQNLFYMGPVPVFYWPRYVTDADDLETPLRMFTFRENNYFGSQFLFDFNGFKLFGVRRPGWIDIWNIDVDYLSARGPAGGTELGWYGTDPIHDVLDPYHRDRKWTPGPLREYFGYFDIWGINDHNVDDLGQGPAVITFKNPFGKAGPSGRIIPYPTRQNDPVSLNTDNYRLRINFRHFQSLNTKEDNDTPGVDTRFSVEAGYLTDRNFLEQYYKRLFDTGLDQEAVFYGFASREDWAATFQTELNPYAWQTETQWLPKVDYYRLGDSLLDNRFTYFGHTGVDWASTHTANDVNNVNTIYFLPYDPVSNTSRTLNTGRYYTAHEFDMPINLGVVRVVPYAQGQLAAWDHQIDGGAVGRAWGAVGGRADIMAYKPYPNVESELMNVHGFNHKIDFMADFRDAWSNVNLNTLGIQDDIDDNSYEMTRRYFAMMNYAGGLLPPQYDPRFLMLRRAVSPITQSTDIQATIETLHMGIHQRLQTKRGPEGRRRIIDYMVLDVDSTYFPNAKRDNFGTPWGQNTYNFEWYIGDRTAITSYGWFEFFDIGGSPLFKVVNKNKMNPNGVDIITSGINITRPPRGMMFIGYSVVDTGLIQTSALLTSYTYWMSPKWYGTLASSYDFANSILLNATGSVTRIGRDYLTTVGLSVVPLQHSFMFAFEIAPRLSPSMGFGSGSMNRLDTRYAPKD